MALAPASIVMIDGKPYSTGFLGFGRGLHVGLPAQGGQGVQGVHIHAFYVVHGAQAQTQAQTQAHYAFSAQSQDTQEHGTKVSLRGQINEQIKELRQLDPAAYARESTQIFDMGVGELKAFLSTISNALDAKKREARPMYPAPTQPQMQIQPWVQGQAIQSSSQPRSRPPPVSVVDMKSENYEYYQNIIFDCIMRLNTSGRNDLQCHIRLGRPCNDPSATLQDFRESAVTLNEIISREGL